MDCFPNELNDIENDNMSNNKNDDSKKKSDNNDGIFQQFLIFSFSDHLWPGLFQLDGDLKDADDPLHHPQPGLNILAHLQS